MSANERRAEIIKILEGRRQETVSNLAITFGVSIRTIKYDIETLTAEYPIETIRGNGGGIRLPKGYHDFKGDITEDQQKALLSVIAIMDKPTAKALAELLRAHGSVRNKGKIEHAIKHM